jgi:hypothetical protein
VHRNVADLINVTKCTLLSPFIGGCVDCNRKVIQSVTADADAVYCHSQRRRTQKYSFCGPEAMVSLEHKTGRRENRAFLNLTVEEDVMLCYVMLCYVMLCYVMLCYVHQGYR